jgi:hypothetical protein
MPCINLKLRFSEKSTPGRRSPSVECREGENMTATKISRPFRIENEPAGQGARVAQIEITPGHVTLRDAGELTWHQAQRYAEEVLDASIAARVLAELGASRAEALVCAKCDTEIRQGVVSVRDPEGGVRHVVGSPECGR